MKGSLCCIRGRAQVSGRKYCDRYVDTRILLESGKELLVALEDKDPKKRNVAGKGSDYDLFTAS